MSNKFQKTKVGKATSVFVSLTTTLWLSSAMLIMPTFASAQTAEELNAQIQTLLASIATLQAQLAALQSGGGAVCGYTFGVNLKQGNTGADVKNLQTVLNSDSATQIAASGVGSSGNETTYFGSLTKAAVAKFQQKYAADILTPLGLTAGTGYVGASTRAKLNVLFGTCAVTKAACEDGIDNDNDGKIDYPADSDCTSASDTSESAVAAGTGLTVSSPAQPTATIAPQSAARLPFTKITLTAGSDGDVVVNGVQIERTCLATDAVFAGIVLLDENGLQLGLEKTLNSEHKATIGEAFTVKAGQSRTMTIAGNMAADNSTRAGQVACISVTGISTSATVTGTLPITGAAQTINATLSIGTVTMSRGATDPGANQTAKEVGTTGYTFSAVKATAGSAEKIRIKSIRWNQSGSAASSDLANIKTYVDSTAYDVTVSSDGKYYTSTFGDGIVVDKGNNVEIAIKGDIVGGSARTIDFDIYKRTDLYVTGETYGYGITPPNGSSAASADSGNFSSTNPWYDAFQVTVSSGTINIQKATSVAAQNIAINLANQPLGGFIAEVKGEPISVAQMVFTVATTTGTWTGLLTNVSLFDANGAVLAGPVDTSGAGTSITFTDTVTFPIGTKTYTLKGKVPSTASNNGTYGISFTPSTAFTTVTGQTTGNTITPSPSSAVTLNTMTVKSASLAISVSPDPVAQTVVAGGTFTFANYYFDASASGEDVRMASIPLAYGVSGDGTATNLTSCSLYDSATALNTGSNVVNPSAAGSSTTFTFDGNGLVVPKGTIKTLALKCNIAGGASGKYLWGVDSGATFSGTGLTSGQSVTPTATDNNGQLMTLSSAGTFTVLLDSSSPSYAIVAGGSTGNTLSVLKFHANNEAINLQKVALQLSSTASNSPQSLTSVTLWDGSTQVGSAIFTTGDYATSTFTTTVTIPKDGDKIITVKGSMAKIGTSDPGTQGHLIAVDYDGTDATGTQGVGANSGTTINQGSSSDTSSSGVRVFRSFPTVTKVSVPTNTLSNGTMSILRFKVAADSSGDVGLYKFSFKVSTTTATADSLNVYAYTDSGFSIAVSGVGSGGKMMNTDIDLETKWASSATQLEVYPQTTAAASTTIQVSAGASRYFDVVATIAGATTGASISTQLEGDAAYPQLAGFMGDYVQIEDEAGNNDDLIWSPNATTTSTITHADWTNGYGVSGLPSVNMSAEVLSR